MTQKIRVWDNFTRIYHISQLLLIALLWYSSEQADFELHIQCAFTLISLWITRLIWGVIGSDTSKFSHFIKSPNVAFKAWRDNSINKPHFGHNPIAGYMIIALLLSLGVQLFTGLFASDDVFSEGPLYMFVSESFQVKMDSLHATNFDILLVLIGLHALAGIFHVIRGDNVIKAIFSGYKKVKPEQNIETVSARFKSVYGPLVIWAILTIIIYNIGIQYASF